MADGKVTRRSVLSASPPPTGAESGATAGAVKDAGTRMSVVVINELTELENYVAAWEELAAAAIEPNVFYEPWMVMPAIRAFGAGRRLQFALILAGEPERPNQSTGPPLLCGIFPLERQSHYQGLRRKLPFKTLRLWKHKYCYLCTPLVRAGYGREVITAFFDWLASDDQDCSLMEFNFIAGDGLFYQTLLDYFDRHARLNYISTSFMRALFRPDVDADTYVREHLGRSRRELKRIERRLSETGRLEYLALEPGHNVDAWVEEFLQLEAISWKGMAGRALIQDEADRQYFVDIAGEAFRRGQLTMFALRLDGRPISQHCGFVSGPGVFAFKDAFDERYARYSPGVLLNLEIIRRLHARPEIRWMDSCADPFHPTLDRLLSDRRTIQDVVVGAGKFPGDWVVAAAPLLRLLNRKLLRRSIAPLA
ncbi:MAG TPA: GNAT family N-acetyltransferase [Blastocatellia bacterium]|nr:GNAT family N-acetyltransferase [Blastocatellia bacterium]